MLVLYLPVLCSTGCMLTVTNIQGALQRNPIYENLDVIDAAISPDGNIVINGCSMYLSTNRCAEHFTVVVGAKTLTGEKNADSLIYPSAVTLKRSMKKKGLTAIGKDYKMISIQAKANKEEPDNDRIIDLSNPSARQHDYVISRGDYLNDGDGNAVNGWVISTKDGVFFSGYHSISFGFKAEKEWPSLGYLLLTPLMMLADIVTFPFQIMN